MDNDLTSFLQVMGALFLTIFGFCMHWALGIAIMMWAIAYCRK